MSLSWNAQLVDTSNVVDLWDSELKQDSRFYDNFPIDMRRQELDAILKHGNEDEMTIALRDIQRFSNYENIERLGWNRDELAQLFPSKIRNAVWVILRSEQG